MGCEKKAKKERRMSIWNQEMLKKTRKMGRETKYTGIAAMLAPLNCPIPSSSDEEEEADDVKKEKEEEIPEKKVTKEEHEEQKEEPKEEEPKEVKEKENGSEPLEK